MSSSVLTRAAGEATPINSFIISVNPLTPTIGKMQIVYHTDEESDVSFEIYTVSGDLIKIISPTDNVTAYWYGRNSYNKEVATGVYLMVMKVNGKRVSGPIKIGYKRQ